jgi:hypothetical protein
MTKHKTLCPICAFPGEYTLRFDFMCERCDFFEHKPLENGQYTGELAIYGMPYMEERMKMDRELKRELQKMNRNLRAIQHQLLIMNRINAIDRFNVDPQQIQKYIDDLMPPEVEEEGEK